MGTHHLPIGHEAAGAEDHAAACLDTNPLGVLLLDLRDQCVENRAQLRCVDAGLGGQGPERRVTTTNSRGCVTQRQCFDADHPAVLDDQPVRSRLAEQLDALRLRGLRERAVQHLSRRATPLGAMTTRSRFCDVTEPAGRFATEK